MQYEIKHRNNYDFVNESLKQRLVPILNAEAEVMFDENFTRLHPSMHWARAYRDSTRWGTHTPDVQEALKLMGEFGMEWSMERDTWGGDWRFKSATTTPPSTKSDKVEAIAIAIPEAGEHAHTELVEQRVEPRSLHENLALRDEEQGLQSDTGAMQQQLEKQQSVLKETELLHQQRQRQQQREPEQELVDREETQKEKMAG